MRALRWTGNVFIVVGLTLLFFVFYELVGTSQITNHRQNVLADEFDAGIPDPVVSTTPTVSPSPRPKKPPARGSGPVAIARIRIPKIGVNNIVVEGVTLADLAWGPGHYKLTAPPGGLGTTGIAGHRTGWGSPFIDLDRLSRGDTVILETSEAVYTYRVTGKTIVDPEQTQVLWGDPNSKATHKLTLTTCTPKFTSLRRLIGWGDLVKSAPR